MTKPSKSKAVDKLQLSRLSQKSVQQELMGDDLDLHKLLIYLKKTVKFDAIDRVKDITVERTIEGASTVVVTIIDEDRAVLRTGLLNSKLDIDLDGLFFRLVKVAKRGNLLDLTFEDREIAVIRTYRKHMIALRSKVTRAEFILRMIRQVKEFHIPVVIPQLHKVQPIEKIQDVPGQSTLTTGKAGGIPEDTVTPETAHHHGLEGPVSRPDLTVKGSTASKEQIHNANIIIHTGISMGVRRKLLWAAITVAIVESELKNVPYGDRDSIGLFQQRNSWGSRAERLDPATAARMFYLQAQKQDALDPGRPLWDLCQAVQVSAYADRYQRYATEGSRFVAAYGIPGSEEETDAAGSNNSFPSDGAGGTGGTGGGTSGFSSGADAHYLFYRGVPDEHTHKWKREDGWLCIQRLADEVQWRAFFVSGTFYFMSEDQLYKQKPLATIREFDEGVEGLDGDYDQGKKAAVVTLTARVGTWLVPPGALVVLKDMGPWNGRWLVSNFQRSLFESVATISLKKPQPKLPEPAQNDLPNWAGEPIRDPRDASNKDPLVNTPQFGGVLPEQLKGTRDGVVEIAKRALAEEKKSHYHYAEIRPYPNSLWSSDAHRRGIDCSSFVTLVYKEASCPDPNALRYNGTGFTGTLIAHGAPVPFPRPGDLVFYRGRGSLGSPGHVAIFIGGNKVIEIGSDNGILELPYNYRSDIIGYRSYLFP